MRSFWKWLSSVWSVATRCVDHGLTSAPHANSSGQHQQNLFFLVWGRASSNCCWLKSVPQVCVRDVTNLLLGRYSGAPIAGQVRNSSSRLVAMQPQPNSLSWHSKSSRSSGHRCSAFPARQQLETSDFCDVRGILLEAFFWMEWVAKATQTASEHVERHFCCWSARQFWETPAQWIISRPRTFRISE